MSSYYSRLTMLFLDRVDLGDPFEECLLLGEEDFLFLEPGLFFLSIDGDFDFFLLSMDTFLFENVAGFTFLTGDLPLTFEFLPKD
jgi:hypothetical protein